MKQFKKISLCLMALISSASMFGKQPNEEKQQPTQEQREAAAREQFARNMQAQLGAQLAGLNQMMQGLPTPAEVEAQVAALLASLPRNTPNNNNQARNPNNNQ